ncbi:MAG: CRISPR-associated endonuclease Cas4g/Cas1g [Polyangiaceae bacterium]
MPFDSASAPPSTPEARPKILPRRLAVAGSGPAQVPARMINEVLYCERLLYMEWAQGEFTDNAFTVEGRATHRRADQPGGHLPVPPASVASVAPPASESAGAASDADADSDVEKLPYQARTLWLTSDRLGITAKIDVVEGDEAGNVVPIEYKRGRAPELPEGAYLPERAQLCAQVLLLREHGYRCDRGDIYFAGSRKRVAITIDEELIGVTIRAAERARELTETTDIPPPLVDSPKCNGCSLVGICLPDEVNLLRGLERGDLEDAPSPKPANEGTSAQPDAEGEDPWELAGEEARRPLRRLHPASDEKLPLYIQDQGARVGLDGDCLVVRGRQGPSVTARLPNTSHVALYGNVQVTAQAMRALLERSIPVSFFSYGGWYYGRATGVESKNVELRMAQHRAAADTAFCLRIARGFVASKIRNSRTMLRRNHVAPPLLALGELEQLAKRAERAEAIESLLGIEGTAARTYFGAFPGMLKGEGTSTRAFDLDGRNRRPPKDPINALLSFTYSLLTKDLALATSAVGLDPLLGFYHQPRFGRPALALDLMEEFRPLVADSVVIGVINGGTVSVDDFQSHPAGVTMKPAARKRVLFAYERRMEQLIAHPVFGYRISYRRVLEVQARLLGRCLLGEIDAYPSFRTR